MCAFQNSANVSGQYIQNTAPTETNQIETRNEVYWPPRKMAPKHVKYLNHVDNPITIDCDDDVVVKKKEEVILIDDEMDKTNVNAPTLRMMLNRENIVKTVPQNAPNIRMLLNSTSEHMPTFETDARPRYGYSLQTIPSYQNPYQPFLTRRQIVNPECLTVRHTEPVSLQAMQSYKNLYERPSITVNSQYVPPISHTESVILQAMQSYQNPYEQPSTTVNSEYVPIRHIESIALQNPQNPYEQLCVTQRQPVNPECLTVRDTEPVRLQTTVGKPFLPIEQINEINPAGIVDDKINHCAHTTPETINSSTSAAKVMNNSALPTPEPSLTATRYNTDDRIINYNNNVFTDGKIINSSETDKTIAAVSESEIDSTGSNSGIVLLEAFTLQSLSEKPLQTRSDCSKHQATESPHSEQSNSSSLSKKAFFTCGQNDCTFNTIMPVELEVHLLTVHENASKFLCIHCGYVAKNPGLFIDHLHSHVNKTDELHQFAGHCNYTKCCYKPSTSKDLIYHIAQSHFTNTIHQCFMCKKLFQSSYKLIKHLRENTLKVVKCPYCSAKDVTKTSILNHIILNHPQCGQLVNVSRYVLCKERKKHKWPSHEKEKSQYQSSMLSLSEEKQQQLEEELKCVAFHTQPLDSPAETNLPPAKTNLPPAKTSLPEATENIESHQSEKENNLLGKKTSDNAETDLDESDLKNHENALECLREKVKNRSNVKAVSSSKEKVKNRSNVKAASSSKGKDWRKRMMKCKECSFVTTHCGTMYKHIRKEHNITQMVICEVCRISLPVNRMMDHHTENHVDGDEDYIPTALCSSFETFWTCDESSEDGSSKKKRSKHTFKKKPVLERNIIEKIIEEDMDDDGSGGFSDDSSRPSTSDSLVQMPSEDFNQLASSNVLTNNKRKFDETISDGVEVLTRKVCKVEQSSPKKMSVVCVEKNKFFCKSEKSVNFKDGSMNSPEEQSECLENESQENIFFFSKTGKHLIVKLWNSKNKMKKCLTKEENKSKSALKKKDSKINCFTDTSKRSITEKDVKTALENNSVKLPPPTSVKSDKFLDNNDMSAVNSVMLPLSASVKSDTFLDNNDMSAVNSVMLPPSTSVKSDTFLDNNDMSAVNSVKLPPTASVKSETFLDNNDMSAVNSVKLPPPASVKSDTFQGITEEDCPDELQFLHPNFEFRCKYCTFRNGTFKAFIHHLYYHFHFKKYSCSYCSFQGFSENRVVTHVGQEHPEHVQNPNIKIKNDPEREKKFLDMCHSCFVPRCKDDVELRERLARKKLKVTLEKNIYVDALTKESVHKTLVTNKLKSPSTKNEKQSITKKLKSPPAKKEKQSIANKLKSPPTKKIKQSITKKMKSSPIEKNHNAICYLCPYCRENGQLLSWIRLHVEICYHIHYKPLRCAHCNDLKTASMLCLIKHSKREHPGKDMKYIPQVDPFKEVRLKVLVNRSVKLSKRYIKKMSGLNRVAKKNWWMSGTSKNSALVAPPGKSKNSTQLAPSATSKNSAQVAPPGKSKNSTQLALFGTSKNSAQVALSGTSKKSAHVAPSGTSKKSAQVAPSGTSKKSAHVAPSGTSKKSAQVAPSVSITGNNQVMLKTLQVNLVRMDEVDYASKVNLVKMAETDCASLQVNLVRLEETDYARMLEKEKPVSDISELSSLTDIKQELSSPVELSNSVLYSGSSVTANLPSVTANLSSVTANLPSVTANLPSVTANLPLVTANLPSVTANLPSVTANLPSVTANLPSVTANLPSVTANLPTDNVLVTSDNVLVTSDNILTDTASVTSDTALVTSDNALITSDNASVTSDNASVTSDNALVIPDSALVTTDNALVTTDNALVISDSALVTADNASVTSDNALVTSDNVLVTTDNALVTTDNALVTTDNALVTPDNALVTHDNALVTTDNALVTTDNALVTTDNALVTTDNVLVTPDNALVPTDNALVTSDKALVITDNALVITDNALVTSDNALVTTDNALVTSDNALVTSDNASVTSNLLSVSPDIHSVSTTLPSVTSNLPSGSSDLSSVSSDLPSVTSDLPSVTSRLSSVSSDLPSVTSDLPSVSSDLPSVMSDLPSVSSDLPSVTSDLPSMSSDIPSVSSNLPSVTSNLPSVSSNLPSVTSNLPSVTSDIPSVSSNLPSVTSNLPSVTSNLPSVTSDLPHIGEHRLKQYRIYKTSELFMTVRDEYGDPVFQCIKCDYTIRNLKSMYSHSYKHQPQIFQCGYCAYKSYPRSQTIWHLKTMHRGKPHLVIDIRQKIQES